MELTEMWEQAHHVNSAVCLSLGAPLNALAIWLIVRHSPEELRIYRKVLLQTATMDLFFLFLSFLVQPVGNGGKMYGLPKPNHKLQIILVVTDQNVLYGLGPVMRADNPLANATWNFVWMYGWLLTLIFVHYSIPLPFVYRYMVLCR